MVGGQEKEQRTCIVVDYLVRKEFPNNLSRGVCDYRILVGKSSPKLYHSQVVVNTVRNLAGLSQLEATPLERSTIRHNCDLEKGLGMSMCHFCGTAFPPFQLQC